MPADPIDLLATTLRRTQAVVDAIAPMQAGLRTPCPDWTVRDLAGHLLVDLANFRLRAEGGQPDWTRAPIDPGTNWSDAIRAGADALIEAWRSHPPDPDGPSRVRPLPSLRSTRGTSSERPANRTASTRRRPNSPLGGCAERCGRSTAVAPSVPSMPSQRMPCPGNASSPSWPRSSVDGAGLLAHWPPTGAPWLPALPGHRRVSRLAPAVSPVF